MGSAWSDAKTVVNEKEVNTTKKKSSAKGASPDQNPNSMGNTTNGSQQTNPPNSDKDQNAANKTNSAEMTNPNQQSSSPNENVVQPYEKNGITWLKEYLRKWFCGFCYYFAFLLSVIAVNELY